MRCVSLCRVAAFLLAQACDATRARQIEGHRHDLSALGHASEGLARRHVSPAPTNTTVLSSSMHAHFVIIPIVWLIVSIFGLHQLRLAARGSGQMPEKQPERRREVPHEATPLLADDRPALFAKSELGVADQAVQGMGSESAPSEDFAQPSKEFNGTGAADSSPGDTSSSAMIVNMVTAGLGSGVLCLPWAVAGSSITTALIIVAAVLLLNAWTLFIIVDAGHGSNLFDLGALIGDHNVAGRAASALQAATNLAVWFVMFVCLIGYFIAIADSGLKFYFEFDPDADKFKVRTMIIFGALAVILPLCFLDENKLAFTSTMTVLVTLYIFGILGVAFADRLKMGPIDQNVYWSRAGDGTPLCVFGLGEGSVALVATFSQCIIIQMCVLPMYASLKDRTPHKFRHIVYSSFSFLYVLLTAFAVIGYLAFGVKKDIGIEENVMNNLPTWKSAQALMIFALIGVYPLMIIPMVAPVKNSSCERLATPAVFIIAIGTCVPVAIWPDITLGTINIWNGSFSVTVFVGLAPAAIGYCHLGKSLISMSALAIAGIVLCVLGFIFDDNYVDSLARNCYLPAWTW